MTERCINGYSTLVPGAFAANATSLALASGSGARLNALLSEDGDTVRLVLTGVRSDSGLAASEIVLVTDVSGDTITVTRAREGTIALPFYAGASLTWQATAGLVVSDGDASAEASSSATSAASSATAAAGSANTASTQATNAGTSATAAASSASTASTQATNASTSATSAATQATNAAASAVSAAAAVTALRHFTATIDLGAATEVVAHAGLGGAPVWGSIIGAADATLVSIGGFSWSGDNLTIRGLSVATANVTVHYWIDTR